MASEEGERLVGAIDQGTSSSRFLVFSSRTGRLVAAHQLECVQSFPADGWVDMDAAQMLATTRACMDAVCAQLAALGYRADQLAAIGVTNQRETAIVWDKRTGEPLAKAVVWLDARTAALAEQLTARTPTKCKDHFRPVCGLPIHPYFSALKIRWLIDNVERVRSAVNAGNALAGTVDSWLIWNLTGGVDGGQHVTDVTNASRYMLMDLHTLKWDPGLCEFFQIPTDILPQIRSSAEVYGRIASGCLQGVPIAGCLGDQQAALVGQLCVEPGAAKNTYGTGTFLLCHTGEHAVVSKRGLLTTVAYQLGADAAACYALEGSGSIGGTCVRWLRDSLGIIDTSSEVEALAASVGDTGGVVFVPAFSGLFSPYWHSSARGTICGISQSTSKAHLARAALEAVCFQTCELIDAVRQDSGQQLNELRVDGGMTANALLMRMQADLLGAAVVRPQLTESTAFGAAVAAAIAVGLWSVDWLRDNRPPADHFHPTMAPDVREAKVAKWKAAVQHSLGWAADSDQTREQ